MNQSGAMYWLLSAARKAKRASARVRQMVARAIRRVRLYDRRGLFRRLTSQPRGNWAELVALPVDNPERNKLADVVRLKPETLAVRARKWLTLGSEYVARETWAKARLECTRCTTVVGPGRVNMSKWPSGIMFQNIVKLEYREAA